MSTKSSEGCLLLLSKWSLHLKYLGTKSENRVIQNAGGRLSSQQIQKEIERYSDILSNSNQIVKDEKNTFLINPEFSKSANENELDLKIDLTTPVVLTDICLNVVANNSFGEVNIFDQDGISTAQSIFGKFSFNKKPFLKTTIEYSATAKTE